ncbi:MAG: pectate lyase [Candidatus Hydrogenedentales bacterium]|jgi:PelA/Pel-15E family pectate lyase
MMYRSLATLLCACQVCVFAHAAEALTVSEASAALQRAVAFFRGSVSTQGGYLWKYSEDLSLREGEGRADAATAWVQPPGTPTIGNAYLTAFERTKENYLLDAAVETGHALVKGQLQSGGWDYRIEFAPDKRAKVAYRVGGGGTKNISTLDDNTTQSAVRFLMRLDKALGEKDAAIHESVSYALEKLLQAQYPNGAWPQRFNEPPDPAMYPVLKAAYPETWSRTFPNIDYKTFYTLNDNTLADTIATMLDAHRAYGDARYVDAAKKAGDFLILAQMPHPQPAWAQQYDADMHPAWARKFEPPAITGGESQGAMRILLSLYHATGEERFLEPIPRALAYLKSSLRPDGKIARFYELQTNKPLYFTKDYVIAYDDSDMPTHYSFVGGHDLATIEKSHETARRKGPRPPAKNMKAPKLTRNIVEDARKAAATLDERGAWVEQGKFLAQKPEEAPLRLISSATFARNVDALTTFIAASQR